jgi:polyisoprenoid-binding protein YceI
MSSTPFAVPRLKQGDTKVEADGKVSGEVVVDATSGDSGSGMRDRKMNKESWKVRAFPRGCFVLIESKGQLRVPASLPCRFMAFSISTAWTTKSPFRPWLRRAEKWTATVHFTVPYQKWGIKNPSFLRVSDTVEIDLVAAGNVVRHTAGSAQ